MQTKTYTYPFDPTLTPQNAKERGYEYIDDIFYEGGKPQQEIVELIKEYGHKLGKPSQRNNYDSYFGIYAPIRDKKNEN